MRYIPIDELKDEQIIKDFEDLEKENLEKMENMSEAEKKEFIRKNTSWNKLQEIFYNLSKTKCWYSEAPPGAGDYEIDHFRPKNRSKQYDGKVLRSDGYWWLAYDWKNYRLSGGLVNKRRKDRLGSDEDVKGKGDYFPLDIKHGSKIAKRGDNLEHELPLLLDPTILYDTSLISFDKNGEPIVPSGCSHLERFRAKLSICLYHLDLEQLSYYRSQVWRVCEEELEDIDKAVRDAANEHAKRAVLRKACNRLLELTGRKAPFSKAAWACIDANIEKYAHWLKNVSRALC